LGNGQPILWMGIQDHCFVAWQAKAQVGVLLSKAHMGRFTVKT
jgi:hypothetical protein